MRPEEFRAALKAISFHEGVPFGRLEALDMREAQHRRDVSGQLGGYLDLSGAFKCFFIETVDLVNTDVQAKWKGQVAEFYPFLIARMAHSFRSLRGAECAAISGYPFSAFTILRNIFDDLVLTSAVLQKHTDLNSILGIVPGQQFEESVAKKRAVREEFRVRELMTGAKSGLSEETRDELMKLNKLFDFEVHGARLSLAAVGDWIRGTKPIPIVPMFDPKHFAVFMNRYVEVAWMIHRLTPALQLPGAFLSEEWKSKWRVLDSALEVAVYSLTAESGKKVGRAMKDFIHSKLPFDEDFCFPC